MKSKIRGCCMLFWDILLINCSIIMAYLIKYETNIFDEIVNFKNIIPLLLLGVTCIKLCVLVLFRVYKSLWRYAGIHELISIVFASFIGNSLLIIFFKLINHDGFNLGICMNMIFIDISLIGGSRLAYRLFRRIIINKKEVFKNQKKTLIIGAGDLASMVINEIKSHSEFKAKLVAIIDEDENKIGRKIHGVQIVGTKKKLKETIDKYGIDEIVIALDMEDNRTLNDIYKECSNTKCKVKILPPLSQIFNSDFVMNKARDVKIEDLLGRKPVVLEHNEISFFIKGKIVLVTGGGGSIGSELCRQISKFQPKKLIILDNYENNAYDIQNELKSKFKNLDLKTIIANIREKSRLELVFKEYMPNIVFHAAAHKHVPLMEDNPTEAISNNILGTLNVSECADRFGIEKFVLISTDKAVNPTNIMGATKRVAEMIIQGLNKISNTDFVAVRFGNVLGSNGSVIPLFKEQIKKGGPVTVTHPDINRFFMTIPEATQLVLQAGAMAKGGEIFVLDMGEPVKICDLAENLIKLSGYEPNKDIKIKFTGLRPGEKLYEELMLKEEGMRKTKNDKIHIAQPVVFSYKNLKKDIELVKDLILTNPEHSVEHIKRIVPIFNNLDFNKSNLNVSGMDNKFDKSRLKIKK